MNIAPVSQVGFKGYVPVKYYAKDPERDVYRPIATKEYVRKCQNFVVRNLNGTAKNNKSERFVNFYKNTDKDYRKNPVVRSVYDKNSPTVYMITGSDVGVVNEFGKNVGIAKSNSMDVYGHSHSYEAAYEAKRFYSNVGNFLSHSCKRLKSPNDKDLTLKVYFKPQYTKTDKIKSFEYAGARFVEEA